MSQNVTLVISRTRTTSMHVVFELVLALMPSIHHAGHMLPDTSCIHLYPLVAVNMFLISATKLSPVCRPSNSRPWHKWIVIMSPRYSQQVSRTSNLYPATWIRRHICIRIQVARPGYMFSGDICPDVNEALELALLTKFILFVVLMFTYHCTKWSACNIQRLHYKSMKCDVFIFTR